MSNENEDQTPAQKPEFVFSRLDRTASIFAIALSIAALLVSLVEVATVRAQQRATAWPYIEISESYTDDGFQLKLTNKGVGPALMSNVTLMREGEPVSNLDQLILETLGPEEAFSYELYSTSNPSNSVVAANETVTLFAVPWAPRTRRLVDAWDNLIDVETCYCSIHSECWQVKLSAERTKRAKVCKTGITS